MKLEFFQICKSHPYRICIPTVHQIHHFQRSDTKKGFQLTIKHTAQSKTDTKLIFLKKRIAAHIKIKYLHYTRGITPKSATSGRTSDVNCFFFAFAFLKKTCFFTKKKNIAKKPFFFENELVFENKFESDSKLNMSIGRHDVYCSVFL